MNSFTFLGADKVVLLNNQNRFTAEDMYSEWKEWVIADDNAKYEKAFDTTGGDDVGSNQEIAPYFFLRNNSGWRIKMPPQNGELVMSGNLFPRDASQSMFIQAEGYDAFLRLEVSTRAVVIRVPVGGAGQAGGVGLTTAQAAQLNQISDIKTATDLIPVQAEEVAAIRASTDLIANLPTDVGLTAAQAVEVAAIRAATDLIANLPTDAGLTVEQAAEVTAIKASTDLITNLPTDAGLTVEQSAEVTAIKALTDLIPALL